jgi:integrase
VTGDLVSAVADYLAHKRALGRKFHTEEKNLHLLVAFAHGHGVEWVDQLGAGLLDGFFSSRPRTRPRSFNNLVGIVGCFLEWTVSQDLLPASPLRTERRRRSSARIPFLFDPSQARQLLAAAAGLPDNSRAQSRGPTYHAVFALCYGLGLRAGEACGLRGGDVDTSRQLLVVRGGSSARAAWSRTVPASASCWPASLSVLEAQARNHSSASGANPGV